jgi:manganese-dependent inorganic pyrophosphatase
MLDYVDDVKEVMAHKRFRDFPVFNREGDFLGMISRRSLLHGRKKQVVLVDHNEKNQAVDGIDEAEVLEIIDHHRLSSIETMGPVFFRNQPVGCTATIVTQMYEEEGVEIDALTASLLCSAIISDTLMFRSPTCTPMDERYARKLAQIAGLNIEEHALGMFNAGSNLKGYSAQEILFLDFKEFTIGEISIGVGQVSSMSGEELKEIKEKVLPQMEEERQVHKLDMIFFMLTNILTESSELICCGQDARAKVIAAYDLRDADEQLQLKGVVSRKKQLIPTLVAALQQ